MAFIQSEPTQIQGRGRSSENLRKFKAHLKDNPGQWWEYDEKLTYNVQAPSDSGFTFTARTYEIRADKTRVYTIWGRFDPVTSENGSESS